MDSNRAQPANGVASGHSMGMACFFHNHFPWSISVYSVLFRVLAVPCGSLAHSRAKFFRCGPQREDAKSVLSTFSTVLQSRS
jgi:hypothetical protein